MADQQQNPSKSTQEEGGVHQDRDAAPEHEQKTPTRGEPLSESDRDRKTGGTDTPASTPRH